MPSGIDWITATFHYPSIGGVVISGGWHHPKAYPFSMEYTLVADGGTIEFSSAYRPPTLYTAEGCEKPLELSTVDGYEAELAYFLECASAGRQPEFCPPQESASAIKLARLMLESRGNGGRACPATT
jgi:predicted dehydrogenase